ncbi:MAG: AAA family ATPase [Candidatus Dormiibacterota bacterium]
MPPSLHPVHRISGALGAPLEASTWPGKSSLLEMLAEAYGLNPRGGSRGSVPRTMVPEPGIGACLVLEGGPVPRWAYFLRADTMHGLHTYLEEHPSQRPGPRFHELSHGEGLLKIIHDRLGDRGFYLLDEPDAPLSFMSCLAPVAFLHRLIESGSQLVVATRSPLVAALPGANLIELGEWGIRGTVGEQLELVTSWRGFLHSPDADLRRLKELGEQQPAEPPPALESGQLSHPAGVS